MTMPVYSLTVTCAGGVAMAMPVYSLTVTCAGGVAMAMPVDSLTVRALVMLQWQCQYAHSQ